MPYKDAYGRVVDVRSWFAAAEQTGAPPEWPKMCNALCHQGDIYAASYAAVPHILEYIAKSGSDWQSYALIASIEEARQLGKAPAIPAELEGNYHDAITSAVSLALQASPHASDPLLSRSIIALLSLAKGQVSIATFSQLDESEQADLLAI
jgi:hypothetical protein